MHCVIFHMQMNVHIELVEIKSRDKISRSREIIKLIF